MIIDQKKYSIVVNDQTKDVTNIFFAGSSNSCVLKLFLDFVESILHNNCKDYVLNLDKNKHLQNDVKEFYEFYSKL